MDAARSIRARAREQAGGAGRSRLGLLALLLGVTGAVCLIAAELSTIASVDVASGACEVINDANPALADRCELSGFERHGGAFLLLGAVALAMAFGAGPGRSRPAALALIATAAVVLGLAILRDLPETRETGAIGMNFEGASGAAKAAPAVDLAAAIAEHEATKARNEAASRPTAEPREAERRDTGERDRTDELSGRHGWAWLRPFRSYDDYERVLEELREEAETRLAGSGEPDREYAGRN